MGISAADVKALREKTGLPMMECKKALTECNGDEAAAIEVLRKKGMAQIGKRAGKATSEGRVVCEIDPGSGRGVIVEVLCETEPVSNTEDFQKLVASAQQAALAVSDPTPESLLAQPTAHDPAVTIDTFLQDVVNRIRENIKLGRVATCAGNVGRYLHHDGKKGVLVEFSGDCPDELKADVCMHIVAMRPPYARREEVPAEDVERERELATESVKGKPEQIIEKIVTGKINKWYSEIVLLEQPFVKDDKKSVGQALREVSPELTINKVYRFEIGEG